MCCDSTARGPPWAWEPGSEGRGVPPPSHSVAHSSLQGSARLLSLLVCLCSLVILAPSAFGPCLAEVPTSSPQPWAPRSQPSLFSGSQLKSPGGQSGRPRSCLQARPAPFYSGDRPWSKSPSWGTVAVQWECRRAQNGALTCVWDGCRVSSVFVHGFQAVFQCRVRPVPILAGGAFQSGCEVSLGWSVCALGSLFCSAACSCHSWAPLTIRLWRWTAGCSQMLFAIQVGVSPYRTWHSSSLLGLSVHQCLRGKWLLASFQGPREKTSPVSVPTVPWSHLWLSASQSQRP